MEAYFPVLYECPLFANIVKKDLKSMLTCLNAKVFFYKKGENVMCEGERAKDIGIVLSGKVQMIRNDYFGNRSIVAEIGISQLFGEAFACAGIEKMPLDVVATVDTDVMLIDAARIISACNHTCDFHRQIIFNLLKDVSTKNLMFHQKIEVTSKRSTREKIMAYLLLQAKKNNSNSFIIPFDRQELADYLEVERSGLSAEISKMRKEGLILSNKNRFTLLKECN